MISTCEGCPGGGIAAQSLGHELLNFLGVAQAQAAIMIDGAADMANLAVELGIDLSTEGNKAVDERMSVMFDDTAHVAGLAVEAQGQVLDAFTDVDEIGCEGAASFDGVCPKAEFMDGRMKSVFGLMLELRDSFDD